MQTIQDCVDTSGALLASTVRQRGIGKSAFYQFIREHHFERLAHGVYLSPDSWADHLFVLHLRCPQAVFSHAEALYYHDLVDREPLQPNLTIYSGYNPKQLTSSGVKVYTIKRELLELGKTTVTSPLGHDIPMYDLERTLCDIVRSRSQFDAQDLHAALHSYVKRQDKDLNRLMRYAKLLRVQNILRTYLEVLL